MVFAQTTSWSLAASHRSKPVTSPSALIVPHEHREAKSDSLPRSSPGFPDSSEFNDAEPVAKDRRSSGFADDVPPPPPPEPGDGVCLGFGCISAGPKGGAGLFSMSGGFPVPNVSSHHFSNPLRSACCSCHSRAWRRRSRSSAASFFIWSTHPATVRIRSERVVPSLFAIVAFSVNSCEKWPRNSCEAVDTYD